MNNPHPVTHPETNKHPRPREGQKRPARSSNMSHQGQAPASPRPRHHLYTHSHPPSSDTQKDKDTCAHPEPSLSRLVTSRCCPKPATIYSLFFHNKFEMLEFSNLHQVREGSLGITENKQVIFSRIIILMMETLPISDKVVKFSNMWDHCLLFLIKEYDSTMIQLWELGEKFYT